jgi:hypothetical protein
MIEQKQEYWDEAEIHNYIGDWKDCGWERE